MSSPDNEVFSSLSIVMGSYIEDMLLSPLSTKYCVYFYYLMVFALVFCGIAILEAMYSVATGSVGLLRGIVGLIGPALLYLNYRLLYSMCMR